MDKLHNLKEAIRALDDDFDAAIKHIFTCGLIDDEDLIAECKRRGCEPECHQEHTDDLTDDRIAHLAEESGLSIVDAFTSTDIERLADAIAEGRTLDALNDLKTLFGDSAPLPQTRIKLAQDRGRVAA